MGGGREGEKVGGGREGEKVGGGREGVWQEIKHEFVVMSLLLIAGSWKSTCKWQIGI